MKPVFEKVFGNWLDETIAKTKQNNDTKHFSTKSAPIQAALKKNDRYVCHDIKKTKKEK